MHLLRTSQSFRMVLTLLVALALVAMPVPHSGSQAEAGFFKKVVKVAKKIVKIGVTAAKNGGDIMLGSKRIGSKNGRLSLTTQVGVNIPGRKIVVHETVRVRIRGSYYSFRLFGANPPPAGGLDDGGWETQTVVKVMDEDEFYSQNQEISILRPRPGQATPAATTRSISKLSATLANHGDSHQTRAAFAEAIGSASGDTSITPDLVNVDTLMTNPSLVFVGGQKQVD